MSFPPYERYRDSGVGWLREVPEHWALLAARRVFLQKREAALPTDQQLSATQKYGVVPQQLYMALEDQKVMLATAGLSSFKRVQKDDFVISLRSFQGGIERSLYDGCVSPAYTVLRASHESNPGFWAYLLKADPLIAALNAVTEGIRDGKTISYDQFGQIILPVPPDVEQFAISAFLNCETAKIDALVTEQKRLIAMLKEKRQAVISHAVTKGLVPNAAMKDSGVEWLGEVPAHWEAKRLKHISPQITVGIVVEPSKYYVESGVPALRSLNVRPGEIYQDGFVYISEKANELLAKSKLRSGDLVAVRSGQPGTTAVVPSHLDGCNCIDLIIIRKPKLCSEWYLCWYLGSDAARRQFSEGSGGAIQQHFNIGTAMNVKVALPPCSEQQEIVSYLDHATAQIDGLIREAKTGIALLRERRSALIFAAVTGKIDVRRSDNPAPAATSKELDYADL